MTIQCSYRTVNCVTCGSSLFTPVVEGRTVDVDPRGNPICDGCAAPKQVCRSALDPFIGSARDDRARPAVRVTTPSRHLALLPWARAERDVDVLVA